MSIGANYQVKASVFRAYVAWLERESRLEAVVARLSPQTAHLVERPPLASTWMHSGPLDEIVEQIEAVAGLDGVKRASESILREQMVPLLLPMVRNILRIIGATPATIYRHWDDLIRTTMRDVTWSWSPTSDTAGVLTVTYDKAVKVHLRTYLSVLAALEQALLVAGAKGVVSDPTPVGDNTARFEIRWTK